MNIGMLIGSVVGGLGYLWLAFWVGYVVLPERWMFEWYGFPTFITVCAGFPSAIMLGMWIGELCSGDGQ